MPTEVGRNPGQRKARIISGLKTISLAFYACVRIPIGFVREGFVLWKPLWLANKGAVGLYACLLVLYSMFMYGATAILTAVVSQKH